MSLRSPHHIYVHFPYCLYKCSYCDFNSFAVERDKMPSASYVDGLVAEIAARRALYEQTGENSFPPGTRIDTIFFGGGTPSLMEPEQVSRILAALGREFSLAQDVEVTLEANPGTLDASRMSGFRTAGINRLSVGVQSLDDNNLARFGRIHTAEQALQILQDATKIFPERTSADLIYGFPDQTLAGWQNDLNRIIELGLSHLSCYALTAEAGTSFSADLKRGVFAETSDELMSAMFTLTHEFLAKNSLPAYEVSNFARPGFESRHNLGYWHYESYLGLGAGACSNFVPKQFDLPPKDAASSCGVTSTEPVLGAPVADEYDDDEDMKPQIPEVLRTTNHKVPETYMRTLLGGQNFFTEERIQRRTAMSEYMMMGLRLQEGIAAADFNALFQDDWRQIFGPTLKAKTSRADFNLENGRLSVAPSALLRLNALISVFLE